VSDILDLMDPESIARLRHSLRTPLNHLCAQVMWAHDHIEKAIDGVGKPWRSLNDADDRDRLAIELNAAGVLNIPGQFGTFALLNRLVIQLK